MRDAWFSRASQQRRRVAIVATHVVDIHEAAWHLVFGETHRRGNSALEPIRHMIACCTEPKFFTPQPSSRASASDL